MWETAFSSSMLINGHKIIVNCPSEDLVQELMDVLAENGVRWAGGAKPSIYNSKWNDYKGETCYWIDSRKMTYECKQYADEDDEFDDHVRCTFYGISDDFEPASSDELMAFLGI